MWTQIKEKKQKMFSKKAFLSWWIIPVLEKIWKMWEKTEMLNFSEYKKSNYLVSEPNCHTKKFFK